MLSERKERRYLFFVFVFFIISLVAAYFTPLFETTEGKYAETAREMIASGDWLIPRLNGVINFENPPLPYWLIAVGIKMFGLNTLGVRFFGIVASILTLIFTRKTAYMLTRDDNTADCAVFIAGSSLIFLIISRVVSPDIYLTAFCTISLYTIFRGATGANGLFEGTILGFVLGLGFLTKGPVIFIFTVLPAFFAVFFNKNYRNIFNPAFLLSSIIIFSIVGLPWFFYIASIYNGSWAYFFGHLLVDKVISDVLTSSEPWYFYIIALFGLFPFLIYTLCGIISERFFVRYSLWFFILFPFTLLQISDAKDISYLTPLAPVAAISAAFALLKFKSHTPLFFGHLYMLILIMVLPASGYVLTFLEPYRMVLFIISIISLVVYITLLGGYHYGRGFVMASAWTILMVSIPVYAIIPLVQENSHGYKRLSEASIEKDIIGNTPIIAYKSSFSSISFYRNKIVPTVFGKERDLMFEKNDNYKEYYINNEEDAVRLFGNYNNIFLVSSAENMAEASEKYGYSCLFEYPGWKVNLYFCSK